jgi:HNH endonuclease
VVNPKLREALQKELPVLFVYIGWSRTYQGEKLIGEHRYITDKPDDLGETNAFLRNEDGSYYCGLGYGRITGRLHVVFVAGDPITSVKKIVGLYADAESTVDTKNWATGLTEHAICIPAEERMPLDNWVVGQHMRRWARGGDSDHPALLETFNDLRDLLLDDITFDQTYSSFSAMEGKVKMVLVRQRSREARLRDAKINQSMTTDGRLVCEVPRCGFDFLERYGELGRGYAHVHHLKSLAQMNEGEITTLDDLAIVCANCHAMIHVGGGCRELTGLIKHA